MKTEKLSNSSYSEHEKDLIELILGIRDNPDRKSTLQLALESARFHCGIEKDKIMDNSTFDLRQDITERINNNCKVKHYISTEADIFSALLLYFICLEQIGTLFYTEDKKKGGETNGIINAINFFSTKKLSPEKCIALKNLRNSLGHAYGLVNIDKSKNAGTHKFILIFKDENNDVIKKPSKQNTWDGNFLDKRKKTSTVIYVFPLIRFIEGIIQNVIKTYHNGNLRFIFYEEIQSRFTIIS